MAIYEFDGYRPVVHESAFVHPLAAVTGNVVIGRDVYVGPGAAIRADWGEILIGDGCNVQECCVIHVFPGATVVLDESAHIGHGAVIHGANIGRNTLVGMNSVVMDRARIGAECVVGAMSFVRADMVIPDRKGAATCRSKRSRTTRPAKSPVARRAKPPATRSPNPPARSRTTRARAEAAPRRAGRTTSDVRRGILGAMFKRADQSVPAEADNPGSLEHASSPRTRACSRPPERTFTIAYQGARP